MWPVGFSALRGFRNAIHRPDRLKVDGNRYSVEESSTKTHHYLLTLIHYQHTFWPKYFYRARIWIVGNIFELLLRQGAKKSWETKNMITMEMSDEYFPHFTRLKAMDITEQLHGITVTVTINGQELSSQSLAKWTSKSFTLS